MNALLTILGRKILDNNRYKHYVLMICIVKTSNELQKSDKLGIFHNQLVPKKQVNEKQWFNKIIID